MESLGYPVLVPAVHIDALAAGVGVFLRTKGLRKYLGSVIGTQRAMPQEEDLEEIC